MKLYIAVQADLPPGAKLAQTAHAVAEIHVRAPAACAAWRAAGNVVVVLDVCPERLAQLAAEPGAAEFREPARGDARTAVALFPTTPTARKILRTAPLAG